MVLLPADGVVMVFTADTKVKVEGLLTIGGTEVGGLISVVVVVNVACTWDDTIGCLCRVTCVVILGKSSSILSLGGENVANICCSARVGIFLTSVLSSFWGFFLELDGVI
jgi:hypothetical protein